MTLVPLESGFVLPYKFFDLDTLSIKDTRPIPDDGAYLLFGVLPDGNCEDFNRFPYVEDKFYICPYGLADNISQILDHYEAIEKEYNIDLGRCVVSLFPIYKEKHPEMQLSDWGTYIGKHKLKGKLYKDCAGVNLLFVYRLIYVK